MNHTRTLFIETWEERSFTVDLQRRPGAVQLPAAAPAVYEPSVLGPMEESFRFYAYWDFDVGL